MCMCKSRSSHVLLLYLFGLLVSSFTSSKLMSVTVYLHVLLLLFQEIVFL